MDTQNKWEESTDAQSSKLQWLDAEMLSVVPGEGAWWGHSCGSGALCLYNSCCKINTECYFHLLPFSIKAKSFWDFFWSVKIRTNVGHS